MKPKTLGKIILDNAGGVTLHLGQFTHHYGPDLSHASADLVTWLEGVDSTEWEGHEEESSTFNPDLWQIEKGQYRVIALDQIVDTPDSVWAALLGLGWASADLMAKSLERDTMANHALAESSRLRITPRLFRNFSTASQTARAFIGFVHCSKDEAGPIYTVRRGTKALTLSGHFVELEKTKPIDANGAK